MTMLSVDNSTLAALQTCTFKAWLRYGQHRTLNEEAKELLAGTATHAALAEYFRGRGIGVALQAFDQAYKAWATAHVPSDDRLSYDNTRTILQQWFSQHTTTPQAYRVLPECVEIYFEVPLADNILYCGIMDAVAELHTHLYVLEHKTTGNVSFKEAEWPLSSQLSGQVYAARHGWVNEAVQGRRIAGALVNAIEFKKLPGSDTPDKKCRVHGTPYRECRVHHADCRILGPYPREDAQLDAWRADALAAATRWKRLLDIAPTLDAAPMLAQEGTFTGACRFCEFKTLCLAGRDPGLIAASTVVAPWQPKEVAKQRLIMPT